MKYKMPDKPVYNETVSYFLIAEHLCNIANEKSRSNDLKEIELMISSKDTILVARAVEKLLGITNEED